MAHGIPRFPRIIILSMATVVVAGMSGQAGAQANLWPEVLALPAPDDPADTPGVAITTRQAWYQSTFTSSDKVAFSRSDSTRFFEQNAAYDLMIDTGLGRQYEYLNLQGKTRWRQWPFKQTAVGLDWRPMAVLNAGKSGSAIMAIAEVGPTIDANLRDFPVQVRSGVVGTGWSDSLPQHLRNASLSEIAARAQTDLGMYAGLSAGDYTKPVFGLPLHVQANGYARVTDSTSRLIVATGALLLRQGFPSGDSAFLYYTDSLSSGREGYLGEEKFINIKPKTSRSFQAMAAIKGKQRFRTVPALIYSFSRYSVFYPDWLKLFNDKANALHSLQAMAVVDTMLFLAYSGGLRLEWEKEEKLYRGGAVGNILTNTNSDSISAKVRDYDGFRVSMRHELSREWANGAAISYLFDVSRYTKRYPNIFFSSVAAVDTFAAKDDNHWIIAQHRLRIQPVAREKFTLNFSGAFSKNTSIYLKKERSAANATDRSYMLGLGTRYNPWPIIEFSENLTAVAKRTEYAFPSAHRDKDLNGRPDDEAPMSRSFGSKFKATGTLNPHLTVTAEWDVEYWDEGYWNGKEFFDTIPPGFREVYAIDIKSRDWKVILSGAYAIPGVVKTEAGAEFGDIYYRLFNDGVTGYSPSDQGIGFILTPFILCKVAVKERLTGSLKLKYTNYNIFNDRLVGTPWRDLLDLDLKINAEF
jgi:hypothetical protein